MFSVLGTSEKGNKLLNWHLEMDRHLPRSREVVAESDEVALKIILPARSRSLINRKT